MYRIESWLGLGLGLDLGLASHRVLPLVPPARLRRSHEAILEVQLLMASGVMRGAPAAASATVIAATVPPGAERLLRVGEENVVVRIDEPG